MLGIGEPQMGDLNVQALQVDELEALRLKNVGVCLQAQRRQDRHLQRLL